jgi:PAS domain S-box-containing protein
MHRLTDNNFQQFFEMAPGLNLVLSPELTIVAVSESYLAATLTKRDAILGKYLFDVFPDNPDDPAATGVNNLLTSLNYVLQHGRSHTMADQKYDIRTSNGNFEERYWRPINTPILDADKKVRWIIHQVEDVTREIKLQQDAVTIAQKHDEFLEGINKDLEAQVKLKTEQLNDILERITDGFIALDKNFCYTYANKRIGELLHRDPASLIGKNVWEEYPDVVGSSTYKAFMEAMTEQHYVRNTDYYEPLDLWQENDIYPSPGGLSVFTRDISVRMKAQDDLKASEQKYRFLFENNPLPIWMLSMPDRNFIAVNNAAVEHYGYSKEEFLSMNAKDMRPAEDVNRFLEQLKELKPGIYNAGIWRHLKKDGTIIQVEIYAHNTQYEGKLARLVLANDVTERIKAEEALRQSEEINRLIMSSSLNAIVCMDIHGNIIFWNPQAEKVFGWEKEEIIGRPMADAIVPVAYREQHKKGLENYLKTGHGPLLNKLLEITAINKEGVEFPVELAIIPVKENGIEFFCSFIQDITERKKSEEKLKQSHEQLRQLASHLQDVREEEQKRIAREVHDELGQQITGLKMDVAWIWKKMAGIKEGVSIQERLKEMTTLLDSAVKTIRKIASELRPSILDDMGLIAAMEWQTLEFQKRFSIPVAFKSAVRQLELDPTVATNLFRLYQESLTNIARHAEAKNVYTELEVNKKQITLSVTDDGKGFQVEESDDKKTLGLLGMKERVWMMNGELEIKSKPGSGTTVTIKVPIQESIRKVHKQN